MKIRIIFMLFFFCIKESEAQIPVNDATWVLKKQDDFDSLKTSNWNNKYSWGNTNNGDEYNDPSNLLFNHTPGYLSIKAEKLTTPIYDPVKAKDYFYKSGAISSKFKYKYGYFEISAKMPKGRGYFPAFWVLGFGSPGIEACYNHGYWNEIDILENGGNTSQFNEMGGGYVYMDPDTCAIKNKGVGKGKPFQNLPVNNNVVLENKYAVLWEADRMTWFFNDVPVYWVIDSVYTPHNAISTIINFAIDPWTKPDPITTFPNYFEINYLKIWQLIPDCSTVENICTFNAGTYSYKVKKSVTIAGTSCSSSINTSSNVKLWATDFILLNEGTTINDNGSGAFSAQITKCPN